jgi:hypothetical protein
MNTNTAVRRAETVAEPCAPLWGEIDYAVQLRTGIMSPRFERGWRLYASTTKPISPKNDVIVYETNGRNRIGTLIERTEEAVTLLRYGAQQKQIRIPMNRISAIHRILATVEDLGLAE